MAHAVCALRPTHSIRFPLRQVNTRSRTLLEFVTGYLRAHERVAGDRKASEGEERRPRTNNGLLNLQSHCGTFSRLQCRSHFQVQPAKIQEPKGSAAPEAPKARTYCSQVDKCAHRISGLNNAACTHKSLQLLLHEGIEFSIVFVWETSHRQASVICADKI